MLEEAAAEGASRAYLASAWMREPGLEAIEAALASIRTRGPVRFLLGTAFNSTSREAVEGAMHLAEDSLGGSRADVLIHSDRPGTTYHPKVYLATSEHKAWLFVGSHNLTAGGMTSNVEAGLILVCHPTTQAVLDVLTWFDALSVSDCTLTGDEVLATLPSEDDISERRSRREGQHNDDDLDGKAARRQALFNVTVADLPSMLRAERLSPSLLPVLKRFHIAIVSLGDMRPDDTELKGGEASYHLLDSPSHDGGREVVRLHVRPDAFGVAVTSERSWAAKVRAMEKWQQQLDRTLVKRWIFWVRGPQDFDDAWELVKELHDARRTASR